MIRLKTVLKALLLTNLSIWMIGCQQTAPLGVGLRYNNSPFSQQQPQTSTDYSNLFNNVNNTQNSQPKTPSVPATQPAPAATSCARYTSVTQSVITACEPTLNDNAAELSSIAPNCQSAFQAITPYAACDVLVPQLTNAVNACSIIFSDQTYSSYLPSSCKAAYQALF